MIHPVFLEILRAIPPGAHSSSNFEMFVLNGFKKHHDRFPGESYRLVIESARDHGYISDEVLGDGHAMRVVNLPEETKVKAKASTKTKVKKVEVEEVGKDLTYREIFELINWYDHFIYNECAPYDGLTEEQEQTYASLVEKGYMITNADTPDVDITKASVDIIKREIIQLLESENTNWEAVEEYIYRAKSKEEDTQYSYCDDYSLTGKALDFLVKV